jgi:hypothetical protein
MFPIGEGVSMGHFLKTKAEIEEEIRRRAQALADRGGQHIVIVKPVIAPLWELNPEGSHWTLAYIGQAGPAGSYVKAAVSALQREWDLKID